MKMISTTSREAMQHVGISRAGLGSEEGTRDSEKPIDGLSITPTPVESSLSSSIYQLV